MLRKIIRPILELFNKLLPKFDQILIQGFPNIEASSVKIANYVSEEYNIPVYFVVSNQNNEQPFKLLNQRVKVIKYNHVLFYLHWLVSKYIFITHGGVMNSFSKRQVVCNIWHGIYYKPIRTLLGRPGLPATFTVATSPLTKKMFAKAFDVSIESVLDCGYPRNDVMLSAKSNKNEIKSKISNFSTHYGKVIIWLPTYRKSKMGDIREDGKEVGNPFYIKNFDINVFDQIMVEQNTVCFVKPHPMAIKYDKMPDVNNIVFINEEWLAKRSLTLYDLAGISDILISDVSSIIFDYLLMDNPIVCISEDFEEYKLSRGFYFNPPEDWVPSKILQNQNQFFEYLKKIIISNQDPYELKRINLKNKFFKYQDGESTDRLIKHIFSKK